MANFKKFLWALTVLPFLTGCSSDSPNPNPDPDVIGGDDGVYMSVNFSPAGKNGSRSFTSGENESSHGVEIGTEEENMINSVLLVLADTDNSYIASSYVSKNISANQNYSIYQATAKFDKTTIAAYYDNRDITTNPMVNVIIYCNPSLELCQFFESLNDQTPASVWVNEAYSLASGTDDGLWRNPVKSGDVYSGGFLMTNTLAAPRYFPASIDAWNLYTTDSNPFDLSGMNNQGTDNEVDNLSGAGGAINVHRAAARFDFADGSQFTEDDLKDVDGYVYGYNGVRGVPFTYAVMTSTTGENSANLVNATIVNMSLVNMLNQEYYLGRVSITGRLENAELLGPEKPWFTTAGSTVAKGGNYVVSPFSAEKAAGIDTDFGSYFFYPFFNNEGIVMPQGQGWYTAYVEDVVKEGNRKDATDSYYVWRYLTENTIPAVADKQMNGQSTGIVFKAKLKAAEGLISSTDPWDKKLAAALNETSETNPDILYYFSGKLYCTWEHVQAAALAAAGYDATKGQNQTLDRAATLYRAVYGDGGIGEIKENGEVVFRDTEDGKLVPLDETAPNTFWQTWQDVAGHPSTGTAFNNFRSAVVGKTFTIYEANTDAREGWGYYCYYYYWNRHNDNGQEGVMGPMEFAVVRNNVYKLAVTKVVAVGHPGITANDPDKPNNDTPDESGDVYITVSCTTLPWVVRENTITF